MTHGVKGQGQTAGAVITYYSRRLTKETVLLRPDSRRDAALYKLFTYLLVVFLEKGPS